MTTVRVKTFVDLPTGNYADGVVLVDPSTGTPYAATGGGGGGGGTAIQDLLFIDDTGTQFIYRDNGATPPVFTAYRIPSGTVYTVGSNPRPYAVRDVNSSIADGSDVTQGAKADSAATSDTGTFSLVALIKRLLSKTNPQAAPYTAQQKATGAAVALPTSSLLNGVVITASVNNAGNIIVGPTGTTATNDGTGNGYALAPGQSCSIACNNANQIVIIGATGFAATDFVYVIGN